MAPGMELRDRLCENTHRLRNGDRVLHLVGSGRPDLTNTVFYHKDVYLTRNRGQVASESLFPYRFVISVGSWLLPDLSLPLPATPSAF